MVAIPITTDQPGMAARVARVGAGEVVPLSKLTVSNLKLAIKRVLEDRTYRDNAARLCAAIQAAGGVDYAADVVEQVIQTNASVVNSHLHGFVRVPA